MPIKSGPCDPWKSIKAHEQINDLWDLWMFYRPEAQHQEGGELKVGVELGRAKFTEWQALGQLVLQEPCVFARSAVGFQRCVCWFRSSFQTLKTAEGLVIRYKIWRRKGHSRAQSSLRQPQETPPVSHSLSKHPGQFHNLRLVAWERQNINIFQNFF